MTRYKGRPRSKANELAFPHVVEIIILENGLGGRLDVMHAFCTDHGVPSRHGRSRHDQEGRYYIRWCFPDPDMANEFWHRFGGRRLIDPMPDKDPIAMMEWAKRNIQRD